MHTLLTFSFRPSAIHCQTQVFGVLLELQRKRTRIVKRLQFYVCVHALQKDQVPIGKCVRVSDRHQGVNNRFLEISDMCQDDESNRIWSSDNLKNPQLGNASISFGEVLMR